ncbi:MAG TPA: F0F1 ATP synthase subunit delta [Candidatus Saccharimonadales bacterium]|nr:F0F1 ATP synthase subunit delta [Candidatus Saccharimonadales bacterium]
MRAVSRSRLARAFVVLLDRYPLPQLTAALAAEVRRQKLTSQLDLLMSDIQRELLERHGYLEAEVTSARPLGRRVTDELEQALKHVTGAKTVRLHYDRDETLLGGLVARTPELEIDLSLKQQLAQLEA